eukprot:351154-Chlamydomonas_euryale.AAC.1
MFPDSEPDYDGHSTGEEIVEGSGKMQVWARCGNIDAGVDVLWACRCQRVECTGGDGRRQMGYHRQAADIVPQTSGRWDTTGKRQTGYHRPEDGETLQALALYRHALT